MAQNAGSMRGYTGDRELTRTLADQRLVVREPDPSDRSAVQLRLSDGADVELVAALYRLIGRLDAVAAGLSESEAAVVADCLNALADAA